MKILIKSMALILLYAGVTTIAYAQDFASYFSASQAFEQLVAETSLSGNMPRIGNKKAADLIATLSDSQRFLDSATYQLKNISSLTNMCDKANAAVAAYAFFDLQNAVGEPKTAAIKMAKGVENNLLIFQDELEHLQPFVIRCMAKVIPLHSEFLLSLKPDEFVETQRAEFLQSRNWVFRIYRGVLRIANYPAAKMSYRTKLLQAAAETAAQYSSVLQPATRQQIFDLVKSAQITAPETLQESLEKIANAMAETSCDGLCKL